MKTIAKAAAAAIALAAMAAAGAFVRQKYAPCATPPGQPPLAAIDAASLPALRDAFNAHARDVRLLVLLSPT